MAAKPILTLLIFTSILQLHQFCSCSEFNPTISYCKIKKHYEKQDACAPEEPPTFISNSTVVFGNYSLNLVTDLAKETTEVTKILLKCESTEPMRWMAERLRGAVHLVEPKLDLAKTFLISTNPYYEEVIIVDLKQPHGRILRCESYADAARAAEVFINSNPRYPVGSTQGFYLYGSVKFMLYYHNYLNTSRYRSILPCSLEDILEPQNFTIFRSCSYDKGYVPVQQIHYDGSPSKMFDPRLGVKLNRSTDFECVYSCRNNGNSTKNGQTVLILHSPDHHYPAMTYSTHKSTQQVRIGCKSSVLVQSSVRASACNSVADCDLKWLGLWPKYYPWSVLTRLINPHEFKISVNLSYSDISVTTTIRHGMVECSGVDADVSTIYLVQGGRFNLIFHTDYYFIGFDDEIYYLAQEIPTKGIISITAKPAALSHTDGGNSTGNLYDIVCKMSTFVLVPPIVVVIFTTTGESKIVSPESDILDGGISVESKEAQAFWKFRLQMTPDLEKICCSARWFNSSSRAESCVTLDERMSVTAIICISLGLIVFAAAMAIVIFQLRKKYKQALTVIRTLTQQEVDEFNNGDCDEVKSSNSIVPAYSFPYPAILKITETTLKLEGKILGQGEFGVVQEGIYNGQDVAVKYCKQTADIEYFRAFLKEVKVMAFIAEKDHENIVKFLGAVIDRIQDNICLAVLERCSDGNLNEYLRKLWELRAEKTEVDIVLGQSPESIFPLGTIQRSDLNSFCGQIAHGMEYLASKNVIHGDLAARNVLVFNNHVVKLSDFGLSKKLYNCANYVKSQQAPLPWRWMSIESLRFFEFSIQSDVWSYGVTLWEIFSLGQVPFSGAAYTMDFVRDLQGGLRLSKPFLATDDKYNVMLTCWEKNPCNRPTFTDLKERFWVDVQTLQEM